MIGRSRSIVGKRVGKVCWSANFWLGWRWRFDESDGSSYPNGGYFIGCIAR